MRVRFECSSKKSYHRKGDGRKRGDYEKTKIIYLSHSYGVNVDMGIIFADDRYEIISIENKDFKNRYLDILGRKVSAGG